MRKMLIAMIISVAFIMSGISVTTFSTGQFASSAWADSGD